MYNKLFNGFQCHFISSETRSKPAGVTLNMFNMLKSQFDFLYVQYSMLCIVWCAYF